MDYAIYSKYYKPLEDQMFYLSELGVPLSKAIDTADTQGADRDFIYDAHLFKTQLDGKPGDGELELYDGLPKYIEIARKLINKWESSEDDLIREVLVEVKKIYDALKHFQKLIDEMPSPVFEKIRKSLARRRKPFAPFGYICGAIGVVLLGSSLVIWLIGNIFKWQDWTEMNIDLFIPIGIVCLIISFIFVKIRKK